MKIYVAYEQTGPDSIERTASGSLTKLLNILRKQGGEFTVAFYNVKPTTDNMCILAAGNVAELEAEWARSYIAANGRLREIKEDDDGEE